MRLSKSCLYGIWSTIYLASVTDKEYVPIREISEKLSIPFHFLTKILQALAKFNIVVSLRGANGGVTLARSPRDIKLRDVIEAIDGSDTFTACVLGLSQCDPTNPCPLHSKWVEIKDHIQLLAEQTSLKALAENADNTKWLNEPLTSQRDLPL